MINLDKINLDIGDYADIRIIYNESNHITLKDGDFEEISSGENFGVSIRVLYKNGWGYVISNNPKDINQLIEKAYKMAKLSNKESKKEVILKEYKVVKDKYEIVGEINPINVDIDEKKEIILESYKIMKDNIIKSITVSYSEGYCKKIFANSEGSYIESKKVGCILRMNCVAKENNNMNFGAERIGGVDFKIILDEYKNKSLEAKNKAIRLLKAKRCPKGTFKVILDPELAGVFIHEAVGHAAEADLVLQNDSIFKDKIGERVGSEYVTIIDNPNIEGGFGSYKYDDEGVRGRETIIIDKGILKSYLHTRETAGRLGMELTGNGRAEGLEKPIVRMSNTYIKPGDWNFEELVEDTKNGIFLKGSRGGQVDTGKGLFQFSAEEAYIIENGELKDLRRDAGLSGEILKILFKVDAVTKDFKLNIGYCGKNGQTVPVGDGGGFVRTVANVS